MTVGHVEGGDEELGQWRLGRKWDEFGWSRRFGGVTNKTWLLVPLSQLPMSPLPVLQLPVSLAASTSVASASGAR